MLFKHIHCCTPRMNLSNYITFSASARQHQSGCFQARFITSKVGARKTINEFYESCELRKGGGMDVAELKMI